MVLFSFAGMHSIHSGPSYTFVGTAMATDVCCGIMGQVFWGYVCGKTRSIKWVYITLFGICIGFTLMAMIIFLNVTKESKDTQPISLNKQGGIV